jgi:hypothetical protein
MYHFFIITATYCSESAYRPGHVIMLIDTNLVQGRNGSVFTGSLAHPQSAVAGDYILSAGAGAGYAVNSELLRVDKMRLSDLGNQRRLTLADKLARSL